MTLASSAKASLALAACGFVLGACGGKGGDATPSAPGASPRLTTISVSLSAATIQVGQTATATASGLDQNGSAIATGTTAWSSGTPAVAAVTGNGAITALATGQSQITATAGGKSGSAMLTVVSTGDFSIIDAQFTQGVQLQDGSIPMVLGGNAAVVNVLVRANVPGTVPMQVVLRLFDAAGVAVRTDTTLTSGTLGPSPGYATPSAQFLVPASAIATGLHWQVERDPKHLVPDDSSANDVFPRSGHAALATIAVPPLNVRFVPVVLVANGNATGEISAATIPQYLQTLLSIHPLGAVNAHVGAAYTTTAGFGTAPSGGAAPFWQQLLSELDLARLADPDEPTANWYGVVRPPAGFNYTSYGGFSYIPTAGTSTGAGTRTSAGVQIDWFNRPTQARDLVAHEIGHTFGRQHAPCGGAGAPLDANYPVAGGTLDVPGHDVFSWASGFAASAATVPVSTGDVMGYCFPVWASAYTYRAVMDFRGTATVFAQVAPERITRVLVLRGRIENRSDIFLEPALVFDARPSLPERSGGYTAEGLDASGRVLFSYSFEPAVLDHAPNVRPFLLSIPSTPDLERDLVTIVVRGAGAAARITRPATPPIAEQVLGGANDAARVARRADGTLSVSCADASARGILITDGGTGSVIGLATAASTLVVAPAGAPLGIVCSDGVRSYRSSSAAP